jgi:type III pantothenate kinase
MKSLFIDVGNSSAKLGVGGSGFDVVERCARDPEAIVEQITAIAMDRDWHTSTTEPLAVDTILIASVADESFNVELAAAISAKVTGSLEFCQTPAAGFGIKNSYTEPHRMGVDRWLALVGAWVPRREALLVFDAGTALTCDVINAQGEHEGGFIMPGSQLMEAALRRDTQRIRYDDIQPTSLEAGRSTAACVVSGTWTALVGAVTSLQARYPRYGSILTGGDGQALLDLGVRAEWRPHLVLEGLELTVSAP